MMIRNHWRGTIPFILAAGIMLAIHACGGGSVPGSTVLAPPEQPNLLLIAIDDQNMDLGYAGALVHSPNIDRLASEGIRFNRHYVQFAVCIPSRVSLLTSLRPERTHQRYGPEVWQKVEGAQSWGNIFRQSGYHSVSLGKIWHWPPAGHPDTFSVRWNPSPYNLYGDPVNNMLIANQRSGKNRDRSLGLAPLTERMDLPDSAYVDGKIANKAVEMLRQFARTGEPFMLAVGFTKPHLPLSAPEKYWALYEEDKIELAPNQDYPEQMPEIAAFGNHSFFNFSYGEYEPLKKGEPMDDRTARHVRHAYRAASSFMDAQAGKVLDALKELGLDKNTAVILWSDHGYHLGDLNHWSKHTNFEKAVHSPLIMRVPWFHGKGEDCDAMVETVDLLPTALALCGLPGLEVCDGKSLIPLFKEPGMEWDKGAYHVFNRGVETDRGREMAIGYAVRTDRYRYVSWRLGWGFTGEEVARELYDYGEYPYETVNVADDPAYAGIREAMERLLHEGPPGEFRKKQ